LRSPCDNYTDGESARQRVMSRFVSAGDVAVADCGETEERRTSLGKFSNF